MNEFFFYSCQMIFEMVKIGLLFYIADRLMQPRWASRKMQVGIQVATIILTGWIAMINIVICGENALFSKAMVMFHAAFMAIIVAVLYRASWLDGFGLTYGFWAVVHLIDFFVMTCVYYLVLLCGMQDIGLFHIRWERGIYLLVFSVGIIGVVRWLHIDRDIFFPVKNRKVWEVVVILAATLCITYFQRIYAERSEGVLPSREYITNWGFFVLTIIVMFCMAFIYVQRRRVDENDRLLKLKVAMLEENYRQVLEMYQEKSMLLHDEKHHMRVLSEYIEVNRTEDAARYIQQVQGELEKSGYRVFSRHTLLDLILNMKIQEAERQQIRVEVRFDDMSDLKLKDTELCVMFSNLLDNAIEANQKLPEGQERWIRLQGERKGDLLILNLSNAVAEKGEWKGDRFVTTKEDRETHGFGMQSVQRIVDLYHGALDANMQGYRFSLALYLVGFEKKVRCAG